MVNIPTFKCQPSRTTPIGTYWGRIYGLSKSDHDLLLPAYRHLSVSNSIAVSTKYNPQHTIPTCYTLFDVKMMTPKQAKYQHRRSRSNLNRRAWHNNIVEDEDDALDNENDDTEDEDDTEEVDAADEGSVYSVLHFPSNNHGNRIPTWILGNDDSDCFIANWKIMDTNDENNNDNPTAENSNDDELRMIGTGTTPIFEWEYMKLLLIQLQSVKRKERLFTLR
jgi:hypothetical protein